MGKPQLIICGSIAIDRIMNFPGYYKDAIHPEKLHVLSLSVLLDKLEETPGGVGANIAAASARLGDKPVLLGAAGSEASAYMRQLADIGVDTSSVHTSKLSTASFNVITDMDDNQVGGFYPGAMADSKSLSLKPWKKQSVFVSVSAHDPNGMKAQVAQCKKYGMRLLYDPGQQVSNSSVSDLKAGLEAAEVLIVNDYEMGVLCKKINTDPETLKAKIPVVITTLGKDGSLIEGAAVASPLKIAVAKTAKLLDPTGAGDAYRAGFLYGYLRQWELIKCGQLGSVVASLIVEQHGTQVAFSKQAVIDRYQETFNEGITL